MPFGTYTVRIEATLPAPVEVLVIPHNDINLTFINPCKQPLSLLDPPAFPPETDHFIGEGPSAIPWDPLTIATNFAMLAGMDCGSRTVTFAH